MTKDEALDLALEALEKSLPRLAPYGEQDWLDSRAAITAIKQARSAPVQPVAWMHTMLEDVVVGHRPADLNVHPDRWMPLYKDPTPCQTCQALARTVMMDQTAHDTALPAAQPAPVQPVAIPEYVRKAATNLHENGFQEPTFIRAIVGWINSTPPAAQRPFVGLTDEDLREFDVDPVEAKLMIAKLRSKNNG